VQRKRTSLKNHSYPMIHDKLGPGAAKVDPRKHFTIFKDSQVWNPNGELKRKSVDTPAGFIRSVYIGYLSFESPLVLSELVTNRVVRVVLFSHVHRVVFSEILAGRTNVFGCLWQCMLYLERLRDLCPPFVVVPPRRWTHIAQCHRCCY